MNKYLKIGDKVKLKKKMIVFKKIDPENDIKIKRRTKGTVSSTFVNGVEIDLENGEVLRIMNENINEYIQVLS